MGSTHQTLCQSLELLIKSSHNLLLYDNCFEQIPNTNYSVCIVIGRNDKVIAYSFVDPVASFLYHRIDLLRPSGMCNHISQLAVNSKHSPTILYIKTKIELFEVYDIYTLIFSRQASLTQQTFPMIPLHGSRSKTGKNTPKSSAM